MFFTMKYWLIEKIIKLGSNVSNLSRCDLQEDVKLSSFICSDPVQYNTTPCIYSSPLHIYGAIYVI